MAQVCGERPILPSASMPTQTRLTRDAVLLAVSRLASFSHPLASMKLEPKEELSAQDNASLSLFPSLCRPCFWANC